MLFYSIDTLTFDHLKTIVAQNQGELGGALTFEKPSKNGLQVGNRVSVMITV